MIDLLLVTMFMFRQKKRIGQGMLGRRTERIMRRPANKLIARSHSVRSLNTGNKLKHKLTSINSNVIPCTSQFQLISPTIPTSTSELTDISPEHSEGNNEIAEGISPIQEEIVDGKN